MNERSSRSHTLFTMTVESRLREGEEEDDGTVRVATLVSGREEGGRLNRQVFFFSPMEGEGGHFERGRGRKEGIKVGREPHTVCSHCKACGWGEGPTVMVTVASGATTYR